MRINHNISALKANNQLGRSDNSLSKSLEKLSSGLKINHASDDAAGMAISQKMKTQIAGLSKASNNASDGISVIQTAEGALEEVNSCLQRMRELSVQAANGTYTTDDRVAIQQEITELNAEITRISETTEFNTKHLLDGTIDRKAYSNTTNVGIISLSDTVPSADGYKLKVTQDARQAVLVGDVITPKTGTNNRITAEEEGRININGQDIVVKEGDTYDEVFQKLRDTCADMNIYCFVTKEDSGDVVNTNGEEIHAGYASEKFLSSTEEHLVFVSYDYGTNEEISTLCNNTALAGIFGLSTNTLSVNGIDAVADVETNATDPANGYSSTATVSIHGNKVTVSDNNNFEMVLEIKPGCAGTTFTDSKIASATNSKSDNGKTAGAGAEATFTVLDSGPLSLQIGANAYQTMEIAIPAVTPKILGVDTVNIGTEDGAQRAITSVSEAINTVSSIRAKLGAFQNRLEHAVSNIDTTNENMTESLSRIEDTDMAKEMATYTQYNVLVQAGTSMLAQANQKPESILKLLQ